MVGGKEDDGVVELAGALERVKYIPHRLINHLHHGGGAGTHDACFLVAHAAWVFTFLFEPFPGPAAIAATGIMGRTLAQVILCGDGSRFQGRVDVRTGFARWIEGVVRIGKN